MWLGGCQTKGKEFVLQTDSRPHLGQTKGISPIANNSETSGLSRLLGYDLLMVETMHCAVMCQA